MKFSMDSEIRLLLHMDETEPFSSKSPAELLYGVFLYIKKRMREYADKIPACDKRVLYVSMEILPGRTIANNLMNLPESGEILRFMNDHRLSLNALEELENEPRLGNGGLGRLAACILESAAAHKVPLDVSVIRFRCGLFRQGFAGGKQMEFPDRWLDVNGAYPFEIRRDDSAVDILFHYRGRPVTVTAVPYDIPIIGASDFADSFNMLRMWAVDAVSSDSPEAVSLFRRIDETLYPDDSSNTGKQLRLMQEYFISAATVGDMLRRMEKNGVPIESLPEHFVLHLNDTHPVLMIPELMRILRQNYRMPYRTAYDICTRTFVYTNHTIMSEALEKWDISMVEQMLPEIYSEILQIHQHFEADIRDCFLPDQAARKMAAMDILWDGKIRMANLAICVSRSVNGVAKIHTDILCRRELAEFYQFFPEKFRNVTNGVTQRKFLGHANPELSSQIDAWCSTKDWRTDFTKISAVGAFADDPEAQRAYAKVHLARKEVLRQFVLKQRGIDLPTNFMYDIQVKRIHEYKRQSLGCLKILSLYLTLKKDPAMPFTPTAFIFAGKAAASYHLAKVTIEFIRALEVLVNNDPDVNKKMRVAFIEDFDVSKAERIYAAADCSEQISTASKEASGTGNMKFMMNGALTIGTLDGANVEIHDAVGDENIYLFGLRSEEVLRYEANRSTYDPLRRIQEDPRLAEALHAMTDGTVRRITPADNGDETFAELCGSWLYGDTPDRFLILADFESYMDAFMRMNSDYRETSGWRRKCLLNIANSGYFSSDRMVRDYCDNIWNVSYT